jgi:hypothetical protein
LKKTCAEPQLRRTVAGKKTNDSHAFTGTSHLLDRERFGVEDLGRLRRKAQFSKEDKGRVTSRAGIYTFTRPHD